MSERPSRLSEPVAVGRLTIDLQNLALNFRALAEYVAPAELAGVVKADGYGLGAVEVAGTLLEAGCRILFVAHLAEALSLRADLGDEFELFVLNGLPQGEEQACVQARCTPVLNTLDQLRRWNDVGQAQSRPLPAAIQLDSGMSRLGLSEEETRRLVADPLCLAGIDLKLVMSHLAAADTPEAPATEAQRKRFEALAALLPPARRSLVNSAGALESKALHFDVVRAGIGLCGGAPQQGPPNPMLPVVRLDSVIIQLRTVSAGTGVGYGLTHVTEGTRRLATLATGYADGWPRRLGNRGTVFVGDVRCPIVGRVSMDSMTVDVTDAPEEALRPGRFVELIGNHQSLDQVAADADTIAYEILTQLGRRFTRVYRQPRSAALRAVS